MARLTYDPRRDDRYRRRVKEAQDYVSKFLPRERIDVGAMCAISLAEVHGRGQVTKQMILDRLEANYPGNPSQMEFEL